MTGRNIIVLPDHDQDGDRFARDVLDGVGPLARSIQVVRLPDLPEKGDIVDWLHAGFGALDLAALIDDDPPAYQPAGRLLPMPGTTIADALEEHSQAVPSFPLDVLPSVLRDYAERSAASMSVPVEMVAAPLLACLGSVVGNRLQISPKQGWAESPTLWMVLVAQPGSAKTASLKAAARGVKHLQRLANKRFEDEQELFDEKLKRWKASKSDDPGPEPRKPHLRHYWTSNATTEAIFDRHRHAHGLAILVDELSGLISSFDQYRSAKGSDRQTFLSLWSGTDVKTDRQSRESVLISNPVVPIIGGIQNEMLSQLHGENESRDGLIERFLFLLPDVQPADWTDDDVPAHFGDAVDGFFERLDRIPPMDRSPTLVYLDREAKKVWTAWFNSNARIIRAAEGIDRGFASKWPTQVLRMTLLLHLAWANSSEDGDHRRMITRARVEDAIELAEWFRAHLHRVLPLLKVLSNPQSGGQDTRVVRRLRKAEGEWVTRSELLRSLGNVPTDQLTEQLTALASSGLVESQVVRAPEARKAAESWRLCPQVDRSGP